MKNYIKICKALIVLLLFSSQVSAQCPNNNSQYGTSNAPTTIGASVTLSTCMYGGEYRLVNNMLAGSQYSFETCGDTDFDTQVTVYDNSTGAVVAYNDDFCGLQSKVTFTSNGNSVRVLIDKYNCANQSSCMTLKVTRVSGASSINPCNSISSLNCTNTGTFSLSGSGGWNNLGGPWSTPGAEQVFSFTPTLSGSHNIVITNNNYYVDLYVKSGTCGPTGWTYIDDISSFGAATNTVTLTAGVTYYFLIDDENTSASSGTITVNCPTPAANPCNSITNIAACGTSASYSLSAGNGAWSPPGPWGTPGKEAVFSFTPATSGAYDIQVLNSGYYVDLFYKTGSCSSAGWTYVSDIFTNETNTVNLVGGVTYLFLIDDENTSASSGSINISCPCIPPPGGIDGNYTYNGPFVISGTTIGACDDCSLRSSNDRIYAVDIPCAGTYQFTTCGGTSWDTYLYLRTAPCGGSSIALNDDACGLQSRVTATLQPGTYYIHVEGFSSSSQGTFNLSVSGNLDAPVIGAVVGSSAVCENESGVEYSVSGDFTSYSWSVPADATISSGANTGTIMVAFGSLSGAVAVVGTNSCGSNSASTNVSINPTPEFSVAVVDVSCNGGSDGSISVTATVGTSPFTYMMDGQSQASGLFDGLSVGTYSISIMDANGCSSESEGIVVNEPTPLELNLSGCSNVYLDLGMQYACATIDGAASGGTPGYTYLWSNGEVSSSIIVCPDVTTTYTLAVTDANGCVTTASWDVNALDISCTPHTSSSSSHSSSSHSHSHSHSHSSSSSSPVSSGISYPSDPSCPSSHSSHSGSGSGSSSAHGSGHSHSHSSHGHSSSCSLPSYNSHSGSHSGSGSGSSFSVSCSSHSGSSGKVKKNAKVQMCFNGVTYCVKFKDLEKRMACGYSLGPCDAQQSAACVNASSENSTVSCVCTGQFASMTVRYLGPSFANVEATAKKNCVSVGSFASVTTGDLLTVDAAANGLLYLRKDTYFGMTGSGFADVKIPTNCCNNPVGNVYWPYEVVSWTDTDGNACPGSQARMNNSDNSTKVVEEYNATLSQYPNPAEGLSNFEFTVPVSDDVQLSIVNVRGQIIYNVFNGMAESDKTYKFAQDVSDLQSGIYFVFLNTSKGVVKKKFVILK